MTGNDVLLVDGPQPEGTNTSAQVISAIANNLGGTMRSSFKSQAFGLPG